MSDQHLQSTDEVLDESINSLKSIQIGMSASSRTQLARRCAQEAASSPSGLLGWLRGIFAIPVPQAAMATAFGLLVLFGVTAVMLSERSAVQPVNAGRESQVQLVSLRPDASGRITLE